MTHPDRDALDRAAHHALQFLESLETRPVATTATLDELRARLARPLPEAGTPAAQVVDELACDALPGILGVQTGRNFAWVIGGGTPAAMGADWLTTVWDQNAGIHACAPAACVVEEIAADWLKVLFDLPAEAGVAFTTGAQMAHATCLAAARHAVLRDRGWDVEAKGLCGAPRIRILANAERHGSVDRAVRLLGLGTDSIVSLELDSDGRVSRQGLARALAEDDGPAIVVLQAGDLNRAAFDAFAELAPLARAAGAWLHVDGAFGLWAKVAPGGRALADGIELCDSWTTDAHKYLNVPYDSGLAFVRDAAAHRSAMTLSTSYLPAAEAGRDPIDWNPEFSRRARGFTVYAALRELGREGLAELVERTCRQALALTEGIGALPGAEVVARTGLNQGLVRFGDDARTDAVIEAINATGEAYFGGVTWRGRRCMRISVANWRTTEADVARAIAAAKTALEAQAARASP